MRPLFLALVLTLLLAAPATADIIHMSCTLTGAAANAGAGTGSPGTGNATVTYDDETGELSWVLTWSGLLAPETLCHFHGPALPNQNAGVQVNIFNISGMVSPSAGSTIITPAQGDDLVNELYYINLHTTLYPAGEIRGQVLVESVVPADRLSISTWKAAYR